MAENKEYSEEQQEIFEGVKEVIDNDAVIFTKVSEDENINVETPIKLSEDEMPKSAEGKYQAGAFREINLLGAKAAVVLINGSTRI